MKIEISRKTAVVVAILLLAAQYALYRGYIELAHYRGEKPMVRSERVMGAITTTKPAREQLVIGFIGDSITEGGTPSPPTSVGKMLSPIAGSVIIVNCAKGGTNVVDWTPGQRFYQTAVKAFHEQNVSWVSLMLGSNVEDAGAGSFAEHLMPLLKALRQEGFKIIIHYPPYSERATRGAGRMRAIQAVLDDAVGKKLCFRGDVAAYEHFHLHPEQLQDGLHQIKLALPRWLNCGRPPSRMWLSEIKKFKTVARRAIRNTRREARLELRRSAIAIRFAL